MLVSVVNHSHAVHLGSIGWHVTEPVFPLPSHAVAVNETVPSFLNVTIPVYVSISATSVSEDDHFTHLLVALPEVIVALRVCETPTHSSFELVYGRENQQGNGGEEGSD